MINSSKVKSTCSSKALSRDEFYLRVIEEIVQKENFEFTEAETEQEMIDNINKLTAFLSTIIEIKIENISGEGIIIDQNREEVRNLLELIIEIIEVINKSDESEDLTSRKKESKSGNEEQDSERAELSCPNIMYGSENESSLRSSKNDKLSNKKKLHRQ